jgi:SAM-dependent methyltransferase
MDRSARAHWDRLASNWRIVEPLAPGRHDIDWYERESARIEAKPLRALLLGVTASIATMRWPVATQLLAADWSPGMLRNVWPASGTPVAAFVACADWRELPIAAASRDLAIGDGCYSAFSGAQAIAAFNAELYRVLRPGGRVLIRCFCRPATPLVVADLFEELLGGRIRNLDLFRWLLAMALQGSSHEGVAIRAVWDVWAQHVPDGRALRESMGWTEDGLANIERWAQAEGRYTFLTPVALRQLAAPYFDVVACDVPGYDRGELFPRLHLRARG